MLSLKKKFINYIISGVFITSGLSVHASAAPSSAPTSDKILERPSWLPELPKINSSGFATDTSVYLEMRKRVIDKKDKKAVEEIYKLAKKNHIPSIVLMGYIHDNNTGVVNYSPQTAAHYWAIGAKAGDTASLYNLGILYMNGRGVPRNMDTAEKLFSLAAERGMLRANYAKGQILEQKREYSAARSFYEKCVNAKALTQCKTRYGIVSVTRIRLAPHEANRVVNLLAQASREGDLEATYTLARLAAEGIVVNKSLSTMVYYLEEMVKSPNSTPYYKKLAIKMYNAYRPSEEDIKRGKDNYRISNAGSVSTASSFKPINLTKTVLDAGNIIE